MTCFIQVTLGWSAILVEWLLSLAFIVKMGVNLVYDLTPGEDHKPSNLEEIIRSAQKPGDEGEE